MPYNSIKQLPAHVKKYSEIIQRQWMYVFNSTIKRTKSEQRAFMAANSVLKKRFENNKESHSDHFNHLVNIFLDKLKG